METPDHMYKEDNKVPTPDQEDSNIMVEEQSDGDNKETADTNNFDEENQVQICHYFNCKNPLPSLGAQVTCRCGFKYCAKHRTPESHECTYNYQAAFQQKLRSENPTVNSATIGYINDYESFVSEYDRQHPDKIYRCWHFWG